MIGFILRWLLDIRGALRGREGGWAGCCRLIDRLTGVTVKVAILLDFRPPLQRTGNCGWEPTKPVMDFGCGLLFLPGSKLYEDEHV